MKKAFTLIELLVVVAIMGLLGTASVGGYRQMQRGMEERGVMQNVNTFLRGAYNRAQIDRQPVDVYFWNETIRARDEQGLENEIVVGRAVAVRRHGRVTRVTTGPDGGNLIIDEFGDFEQYDEDGKYADAPDEDSTTRLYMMEGDNSMRYSVVKCTPRTPNGKANGGIQEDFVTHNPIYDNDDRTEDKGTIIQYGYESEQDVGANWKVGSAYGFEFQTIELPHGYLFGSQYSTTAENPVKGENKLVYKPGVAPAGSVDVYSIRPGQGGSLTALKVATADKPNRDLR